jgi:hypothetical protein
VRAYLHGYRYEHDKKFEKTRTLAMRASASASTHAYARSPLSLRATTGAMGTLDRAGATGGFAASGVTRAIGVEATANLRRDSEASLAPRLTLGRARLIKRDDERNIFWWTTLGDSVTRGCFSLQNPSKPKPPTK